jgi:predicted Zn-dependent protease
MTKEIEMNIRKNKAFPGLALFLGILLLLPIYVRAQDDPLVNALKDEMTRATTDLHLESEAPPYFLGYLVNLEKNCQIRAQYGSIVECNLQNANQMFLDLRVGDYTFDNSNVMAGFFGVGLSMANIPVQIAYQTMRKAAWLQIDGAYKDAIENIARKRAILQSMNPDDTVPDLAHAEAVTNIGSDAVPEIDTTQWKEKLAKLSAIFDKYPQFKRSSIQLNTKAETRYVLNSEGTVVKRGRNVNYIIVDASALDKDGYPVYQYDRIVVDKLSDFPNDKDLSNWVEDFAKTAAEMVDAGTIDTYIGPVIFTPRASAQLFNQLFVENVSNPRKPLTQDSRFDNYLHNARLVRKLGFRVMPEFLSVIDDPTISEYQGLKLMGHYEYDDQGVPAQKINLVEKGKLKSYYMSRTPTKKIPESNGHGRMIQSRIGATEIVGKPGNVILQAGEVYTPEQLKQQMLELCRAADLDYGLIIDQMNFSGRPNPDEGLYMQRGPRSDLPRVINAYMVSAKDGSVTPVRNLEFDNINERALKDILSVGDDFTENTIMFDISFNNLASIVVPSILFEEMELKKADVQSRKQPIALSPLERE